MVCKLGRVAFDKIQQFCRFIHYVLCIRYLDEITKTQIIKENYAKYLTDETELNDLTSIGILNRLD